MLKKNFNIAFLEIEQWQKEYIKKELAREKAVESLDFYEKDLESLELPWLEKYEVVSPFIYSQFTRAIFERLPHLRLLATRSTGFDHIDLQAAKKRKVKVANVPTYGANTVAEHTFALILSLSRKLPQSVARTKKGDFDLAGLRGFDLKGKIIGVVGTGNIGSHVVRIAHGFGMDIVAYDPHPKSLLIKKYKVQYRDLDTLLNCSDIITLHVPLVPHTRHLINKTNIKKVKKGAYIINTARGGLIDTEALLAGLTSGTVAGAGLDVLEEEENIKEEIQLLKKEVLKETLQTVVQDHILLKMDNVIVTPHNAFNSQEALQRILDTTIDNILAFIQGKPVNLVGEKK